MKKIISFLFLVTLTFFVTSCKELQPVEIVGIESAKIITMDARGIEVELMMKLKNPNSMGFTVTGGDLDVQLGKINMGKAHLKGKVKVPANSEKSHTFRIVSSASDLLSGGLSSLLSIATKGNADVIVKGFIKVRAFGISKKFPVDEKSKVPMMK
jgi:LEA14-like dessication related protein